MSGAGMALRSGGVGGSGGFGSRAARGLRTGWLRAQRLGLGLSPFSDPVEPVPAEPPLHVWRRTGSRRRLIVSIWDLGRNAQAEPRPAMADTLCSIGNDSVLFLADATRSWLNAPGLAAAMVARIEAEVDRLRPEEVVAVGNSLGATSALHLARRTRIDRVLATGPRFSVDPQVVAAEARHFGKRGLERPLQFRDLSGLPPEGCEVTILLGGTARELAHAGHFATGANQRVLILPDLDHHVATRLRQKKLLRPVARALLGGRVGAQGRAARLDRLLAPLGAVERDAWFHKSNLSLAEGGL